MDLKNAKREAYSLARRHFLEKAIAEIPIEFEDLSWISYLTSHTRRGTLV